MNYKRVNWVEKIKGRFFNKVTMALHQNNFLTNLFHTTRHSERSKESLNKISKPHDCIPFNTGKILKQVQDDSATYANTLGLPSIRHREALAEGATHVGMFDKNRRAAFTLAEVLITLGIIGVVAALTIPALIMNYQEKQTITKLQKSYAALKNAFDLAKVEHGDYDTWSWNQLPTTDGQRTQYFWETYIFPHLKITKTCFPVTTECVAEGITRINGNAESVITSTHGAFVMADGTTVFTWAGADTFYPHIWVYVDINGKAKPNVIGKDIFTMYFSPGNPGNKIGTVDDDNNFIDAGKVNKQEYGLTFYGEADGVTVDELMSPDLVIQTDTGVNSKPGCSTKGTGYTCGAAIKLNGWKFPENYPK